MVYVVLIHIISAIIFIGNIITAAFWKLKAEFSKDQKVIHITAKNVMVADFIFTLPSIVGLLITGNWLAINGGYKLTEVNWLSVSLGLFIFTGLLWIVFLLPLQRKMIQYSGQVPFKEKQYKKVSRAWDAIGIISTIIPLVVLYFMVVKPF